MLKVTDRAKQKLDRLLKDQTEDPEIGIKLIHESGHIGMVLGKEQNEDQVVELGDEKVLIIPPEIDNLLGSATLDVKDSGDGEIFYLSPK